MPLPTGTTRPPRSERLAALRQFLLDGVPRAQLSRYAARLWKLRPHVLRKDLRILREEWAAAASSEDVLAHIWLAKEQREQLLDRVIQMLSATEDPAVKCRLLAISHNILCERDKWMLMLVNHRREVGRDASPDRPDETPQLTLPLAEWEQRLREIEQLIRLQVRQELLAAETDGPTGDCGHTAAASRAAASAPRSDSPGLRGDRGCA